MDHCNRLTTTTKVEDPLRIYKNCPKDKKYFTNSYDSVIGMMLYLESNKSPYIHLSVN